jgi:site-specific recombinase XerD
MLCLSDLEFNLKSVRVIGKGDKERLVPLPEAFGQVFGFWLKDQPRGEFVFARAAGQKPVSSQAARAYLRGMLKKAGIEKKISPHKLRHTYATDLLKGHIVTKVVVASKFAKARPPSFPRGMQHESLTTERRQVP